MMDVDGCLMSWGVLAEALSDRVVSIAISPSDTHSFNCLRARNGWDENKWPEQ